MNWVLFSNSIPVLDESRILLYALFSLIQCLYLNFGLVQDTSECTIELGLIQYLYPSFGLVQDTSVCTIELSIIPYICPKFGLVQDTSECTIELGLLLLVHVM